MIEGGNDPRRFVADLLERLRDLVILAAVPDAADKGLIDAPADVIERMQAQAGTFGPAELGRAADIVNAGLTEMRGATSPRLQLELICARVLLPAAYGDERSLMARLDRIERGVQFSAGGAAAGVPALGYIPGPEAHHGAAAPAPDAVEPGGGPAAARAAVRTQGQPTPAAAPSPDRTQAQTQAPAPAPASPSAAPQAPPAATAAPAPATPAPGAWPTATPAGGGGAGAGAGRRPGGWPTAAPTGGGASRAQSPQPAAPSAPAASATPSAPPRPPLPPRRPVAEAAASTPACSGRTSWRRSRTAAASPGSCSARTPR